MTAFHLACEKGSLDIAETLMEKASEYGIDLNAKTSDGDTAFILSCYKGHLDVAKLLMDQSKKFGINLNDKDENGFTAFHCACSSPYEDEDEDVRVNLVKLLMENASKFGIDLNVKDMKYGRTAFHIACHNGNDTIVEEMLKFGEAHPKELDLTIKDNDDKTGHQLAQSNYKTNVVKRMKTKRSDSYYGV